MKKNRRISNIISNIFTIIIIIVGIIIYRKYDYNFFVKGVKEQGKTIFSRDSAITYSNSRSYKIENKLENDAMFYKEIEVKPNTPYKVSCMVKTENVSNSEQNIMAGAQICLTGTEEHSDVLYGNNDWTKLEFYFNSKNNQKAEIGFRLGGNLLESSGTAWFADLQIEEGIRDASNTWNFGCFIIDNIYVKLPDKTIEARFSDYEKSLVISNMERLQKSITQMSKGKININYEVVEIRDTITTISYEDENGYYIGEKDIYTFINEYVKQKEYDHIFACMNLPLESELLNEDICEWVGLGNMMYCGKGFSNIRITDGQYEYSSSNTFPEEVFLHEFLHTLERNSSEYGYTVPALHDYSIYGYTREREQGLKRWYQDYMNSEVKNGGTYIGLPEKIFELRPINSKDFQYSYQMNDLEEPHKLSEVIESIILKIKNLFNQNSGNTYEVKGVSQEQCNYRNFIMICQNT